MIRALLLLLSVGLLWQLATAVSLNDRIVGTWRSSSGTEVTVSYSGQPDSFWIQVGDKQHTAYWLSSARFHYQAGSDRMLGEYDPATDSVTVGAESSNWRARWIRRAARGRH